MKSYIDLTDLEKLGYDNLLKTTEWDILRKRLFVEADQKCSECHKQAKNEDSTKRKVNIKFWKMVEAEGYEAPRHLFPTILHLHHTYYVRNTLPWEYPDSCFKVVCEDCHSKIHKQQKILMFPDFSLAHSEPIFPCDRCQGLGYLSQFYYMDNGICFKCKGAGFEELNLP
jgi:hypothetical protein